MPTTFSNGTYQKSGINGALATNQLGLLTDQEEGQLRQHHQTSDSSYYRTKYRKSILIRSIEVYYK